MPRYERLNELADNEYGIIDSRILFTDDGMRQRLVLQRGDRFNSKDASDKLWAGIQERLKAHPPAAERDWWISGIAYTTIILFVKINGLSDPEYTEKVARLKATAEGLLGGLKLVDCE